jgi:hypothetical protein
MQSLRARALIQLGRLMEARRVRASLDQGPRGEYFDLVRQELDLSLAFHADRPDDLPDDETLHAWARAALARTRFGEVVAYLAWAFERRGDAAMARHLAAEAPERLVGVPLADCAPRLDAWLAAPR